MARLIELAATTSMGWDIKLQKCGGCGGSTPKSLILLRQVLRRVVRQVRQVYLQVIEIIAAGLRRVCGGSPPHTPQEPAAPLAGVRGFRVKMVEFNKC